MFRVQRIGEVVRQGSLGRLRQAAIRNAQLNAAVRALLPAWLDGSEVEAVLDAWGILRLRAPLAQSRTVRQILPLLAERLASFGVRSVRLEQHP